VILVLLGGAGATGNYWSNRSNRSYWTGATGATGATGGGRSYMVILEATRSYGLQQVLQELLGMSSY